MSGDRNELNRSPTGAWVVQYLRVSQSSLWSRLCGFGRLGAVHGLLTTQAPRTLSARPRTVKGANSAFSGRIEEFTGVDANSRSSSRD
jgi:hypothetical protein